MSGAAPTGALRARVARGTIVNAAFLAGMQGLGLVRGFAAAAFLAADELGVWGVLAITLTTFMSLKGAMVSDKYIQQREPNQQLAFQKAFTLELLSTATFATLMAAVIPLLALAYGEPDLVLPGLALVLGVAGTALQAPIWIFYRRMQFVQQRLLQSIEPVIGLTITISMAATGFGYWSLVVGAIVGSWASALAALWASPFRPRLLYDRDALRAYVDFSWPLLIATICGLLIGQGSFFAVELTEGLAGVGALYLAVSIAQYANRVDDMVTQTFYPAICAVRERTAVLQEAFEKSNRIALLWGVPFGVGLALFSSDLIDFVLGERWRSAEVIIPTFALVVAGNQLGFNWKAFYQARGETRPMAVAAAAMLLAVAGIAIPLLVLEGLTGFALGMGAANVVLIGVRIRYLRALFPRLRIAAHTARAVAPTLPAAAVVLLLRVVNDGERSAELAAFETSLYLVLVIAATGLLERKLFAETVGYLRATAATASPAETAVPRSAGGAISDS